MTQRVTFILAIVLLAAGCHVFEDLEAYRSEPVVCELDNPCDGCRPRNACGGCGTIADVPGESCGTCASGSWACDGEDALTCSGDDGDAAMNACGGCTTLEAAPETACGTCDSGTWGCDRTEAVKCMGDEGAAAQNACGGCTTLAETIGSVCGTCDSGAIACDGLDATTCGDDAGEAALNACGGCAELPGAIGDACGDTACMSYACNATDLDVLDCVAVDLQTWYRDMDGDTWGDAETTQDDCTQPEGYVARDGDCNDDAVAIHPEATEVVSDDLDNDCDGLLAIAPPLTLQTLGAPDSETSVLMPPPVDQAEYTVALTWSLQVQSTETTLELWEGVTGSRPMAATANCDLDTCPVTCVNFYEAAEYLNQRSVRDGLTPCYTISGCTGTFGEGCVQAAPADNYTCEVSLANLSCDGWRLPTEAEWEWLARGRTATAFYSGALLGSDCDDSNLNAIAWYCGNGANRAHRVAQKDPNRFGLYDVLGNAAEWTFDRYIATRPVGPSLDPTGPADGTQRVARGGSYSSPNTGARSAARRPTSARARDTFTGFRAVRSISQVCLSDEHLTDDANCGCLGPCPGGMTCMDGSCN